MKQSRRANLRIFGYRSKMPLVRRSAENRMLDGPNRLVINASTGFRSGEYHESASKTISGSLGILDFGRISFSARECD